MVAALCNPVIHAMPIAFAQPLQFQIKAICPVYPLGLGMVDCGNGVLALPVSADHDTMFDGAGGDARGEGALPHECTKCLKYGSK